MTAVSASIDIDCPAEAVFSYITDPARLGEWQENVSGGHLDGDGLPSVGTRCRTTRRIGFAERQVTSEITRLDPPRSWSVRGIDGPIRAVVEVSVRALDDAQRCALTISIDFVGHGIGKLLVPLLVRREAAKEMPRNLQRAKANLERAHASDRFGAADEPSETPDPGRA